ncbi:MAG: radical SAM/SPASM domain-containing protein [bacterium]|nr:radical SAM/SPASM domain-containing protein [bacterium]
MTREAGCAAREAINEDIRMEEMESIASRHGTFIGKKHEEGDIIFHHLRDLLAIELERLASESENESERHQILTHIQNDLGNNFVSQYVKDVGSMHFTISSQELNWMRRHETSNWLDYLVYRYRFKIYPLQRNLMNFPLHLLIEPASICNLRCIMCFQVDTTFTKKEYMGLMPWELFTTVVDQAKDRGCNAVTLASRGEPTLHRRFCQMLHYISDAGIMDLKINTHAGMMDEEMSHGILSAGINEIVFSVDAATKETYESIRVRGKFEEVVANIERFHHIREKHYPQSPSVTRITGIHVDERQDIQQMQEFWSQRVDEVTIKEMAPRWDSYNNPLMEETRPCNFLWERMYVWYDGTVNPCDFDYKSHLTVGNAYESSLSEIWLGEAYTRLRKDHLAGERQSRYPCDRCPLV